MGGFSPNYLQNSSLQQRGAVANANPRSLSENNAIPLRIHPTQDALFVYLVNGGSGGTSSEDESTFTAGASLGVPIMGYDPTSGELLVLQTAPGTRKLEIAGTFSATPTYSSTLANGGLQTCTSAAELLAANASRVGMRIQNVSTVVVLVLYGTGTLSTSNYTFALPACGVANDGSSPILFDTQWQGEVQIMSLSGTGKVAYGEFQ